MDWLETNPSIIEDELDLIEWINDERVKRGMFKLQFDRALSRCARHRVLEGAQQRKAGEARTHRA